MAKSSGGRGSGRGGNHPANQKNPNNPAHQAVKDNRSGQMDPNNPKFDKARQGDQPPTRKK